MFSSAEFVKELIKRFQQPKTICLVKILPFQSPYRWEVQRFIQNLHKHGILVNI